MKKLLFLKTQAVYCSIQVTEFNFRNFSEGSTFHACIKANIICYIAEINFEKIFKYNLFFSFLKGLKCSDYT